MGLLRQILALLAAGERLLQAAREPQPQAVMAALALLHQYLALLLLMLAAVVVVHTTEEQPGQAVLEAAAMLAQALLELAGKLGLLEPLTQVVAAVVVLVLLPAQGCQILQAAPAAPASSSSNTKFLLPLQSSPSSPRRSG